MKIGIATINNKPITKRVRLTRRLGRLMKWRFEGPRFFSFSIALAGIGLESSPRVGVRQGLHQLADLRFQKLICHDQRLHCSASITAASRDGLVSCRVKAVGTRLLVCGGTGQATLCSYFVLKCQPVLIGRSVLAPFHPMT
jgi:hypothetical protein